MFDTTLSATRSTKLSPAILSGTALVRGLGFFGWHHSPYERALKSALLRHDHFYVLASESLLDHYFTRHSDAFGVGSSIRGRFSSAFLAFDLPWLSIYETCVEIALSSYSHGNDDTHITVDSLAEHVLASLLRARAEMGDEWYLFPELTNDFFTLGFLVFPVIDAIDSTLPLFFSFDIEESRWVVEGDGPGTPAKTLELAEALLPDLSALSWARFGELAESRALDEAVDIFGGLADLEPKDATETLSTELWRFAKSEAPTTKKAVIKAVASSVPIPYANPLGILFSIAEIRRGFKFRHEYPILFTALELDCLLLANRNAKPEMGDAVPPGSPENGVPFLSNALEDPGATVVELLDHAVVERLRERRRKCRGLTRGGSPCQRAAGWGTSHQGFGLCHDHMGYRFLRRRDGR